MNGEDQLCWPPTMATCLRGETYPRTPGKSGRPGWWAPTDLHICGGGGGGDVGFPEEVKLGDVLGRGRSGQGPEDWEGTSREGCGVVGAWGDARTSSRTNSGVTERRVEG